ncbi:lasso peptide biosynthesis B2 protein [Paenibacillus tarimensis]
MPGRKKLLHVEAWIFLGWARILKLLPFSKVAPTLGKHMVETPHSHNKEDEYIIGQIARAIDLMSRHTWWESMCLVKAIAAMKMLERRGIGSTLYMGTAKDENGKLIAHAWLRCGPYYITGFEVMHQFTVVGVFGKSLQRSDEKRSFA